ncbi:MAG TPA: Gfo/Idh/MocA family oxidoreductase [Chitinophagales bacterium]|jgi:predicted dehydrogenase|nr:Gfo/Idh/MocA family oxidoreductase [Chitinophagales bacterium]MBP6153283.1 Gfo/Idh/MocA family oxidoreductase [Chitinophagales bacterium]HQV78457.1 Gfo/Idh/MocA family oxidoreductase [Chitinophagales bacterium]HQW78857.1 Gfo/Idh/MocA family oxidoreductase [Chitinophagales bacterium]HRB67106.1 Gfo/Idh/MocA family oxidoreductase [Chitinophagales bacterium]
MIKIGIIGLGRLGVQHFEKLMESPYFKVVGCYDIEPEKLKHIEEDYTIQCFNDVDELIKKCDAVDILTPADSHFYYAEKAIKQGKHVFLDKPISNNLEEAKKIVELVREAGIKFQIGHIERFNPAYLALKKQALEPMFIEAHRLAYFDAHRTDESVILDMMIHDIDIVLSVVKANIKTINASGVSVMSNQIDVANARIEFDNGCVANLTASRTSVQKMRKISFFQKDNHITLDFLHREAEVVKLSEKAIHNSKIFKQVEATKYLNLSTIVLDEYDALKEELNSFAECLIFNSEPCINALDGLKSLEVATEILLKINKINGISFSNDIEVPIPYAQ